jgi:hypothetical protein
MKNPVNIFCFVSFPRQNDDSPTLSTTFLVTHGPDFVLGSFSSASSSNGTNKAGHFDGSVLADSRSVVRPSPQVVENVLCPSNGGRAVDSWLKDAKTNAKDGDVLSVAHFGSSSLSKGSSIVMGTHYLYPLCWTRIIHSCRWESTTTTRTTMKAMMMLVGSSTGPA